MDESRRRSMREEIARMFPVQEHVDICAALLAYDFDLLRAGAFQHEPASAPQTMTVSDFWGYLRGSDRWKEMDYSTITHAADVFLSVGFIIPEPEPEPDFATVEEAEAWLSKRYGENNWCITRLMNPVEWQVVVWPKNERREYRGPSQLQALANAIKEPTDAN